MNAFNGAVLALVCWCAATVPVRAWSANVAVLARGWATAGACDGKGSGAAGGAAAGCVSPAGLGRAMDDFHAQRVSGNVRHAPVAHRSADRGRLPAGAMPFYVSGVLAVVALGLILVRLRQRRLPCVAGRGADVGTFTTEG